MRFFGTDGIRGIVGSTLNERLIKKIANGIVKLCKRKNFKNILVGSDGRVSGDYILTLLASVLLKNGIQIDYLGVCSTPSLAFLTKRYNYPLGVMISASHNPYSYNGIKFFNIEGEKVSADFEANFEDLMLAKTKPKSLLFTRFRNVNNLKESYIQHLKQLKTFKQIDNLIFDCANGGVSKICKAVFTKCKIINCSPNGYNINKNCGCLNIEFLQSICLKEKCIGFAFDGDADRLHIVNSNGKILMGDEILFILSKFYLNTGCSLIGTIYTNNALANYLKKHGMKLLRASVGDKCVYKQMLDNNSPLGGENSGHIIVKRYTNTGDGLLNAILILNIMQSTGKSLDELLSDYTPYHQQYENLKIDNYTQTQKLKDYIEEQEKFGARIIVRKSGTEPVVRIMVEHKHEEISKIILKEVINLIKNPQI